ncbi:MAG: TlpA family protein disulfide reductase [Pirellulales bacterium]|nr:TlpA family protein disulfide reductase [Pirellulales bacterium]
MRQFFASWRVILALMLAPLIATSARAELPSAESVLQIYRANHARFARLRLQALYLYESTEAAALRAQQEADEKERILNALANLKPEEIPLKADNRELTGEEKLAMLEQLRGAAAKEHIELLRAQSKPFQMFKPMEFFRDGEAYQLRTPIIEPKQADEAAAWVFPDAPLSVDALLTTYREISIYSRSPSNQPTARRWHHSVDGHAYVMQKHLGEIMHVELPPFTEVTHAGWDTWHPIDGFFSQPADKYRVIRQEEVDGRKLTVVDVDVPLSADNDEGRLCYRGWLDLERGAIPIRLFQAQGTKTTPHDHFDRHQPNEITTTHEIRELPDGGFYPVKTVREWLSIDPAAPQLTPEQWAEVQAGQRKMALVAHRRHTWTCSLVDNQPALAAGFFDLPFPENQQIYDHDAGKTLGALDEKPPLEIGQQAPPLSIARWLDGQPRSLADLRGQVVVLDFWATWCGPCRASIPMLKQLQEQFAGKPVTFISIHPAERDVDALAAKISEFTKSNGWQFVAAIDSGRMTEDSVTTNAYAVRGFPETLVIGPDGNIAHVDPQIEGPPCDEEDPQVIADFEKLANEFMQSRFAAVGETWPLPESLSEAEQQAVFERASRKYLAKQIETALEAAR